MSPILDWTRICVDSSVRVQFEIGHEASVRTKKTPDGFTHDWEVFVKGADNTDIQYFVDKVVFHLHETFPKPRRVIKEPPYVVKESGYAGFVLPIDVYLKNKEEPKKISFQYDLTLQNSGPPISRVLREPRVFQNPSEDFRRKLIRGGGVGVDTPNEIPTEDHKPSSSLGASKSKPTESPSRKHKPELKLNDSFAELFGTPIRRITPEPKKISDLSRKLPESDKEKKKSVKTHKEDKELSRDKDKYAERDRVKERDKSKDKPPKPLQQPPTVKPKDDHKKHEEKDRKKDDYEEKKKRKEERDKKEKHKDVKEVVEKVEKEVRKEKKEPRENDYLKKLNSSKSHENRVPSDKSSSDIVEKERERSEKEKHKHRHKKKEKEKNREKEKHKKDKEKNDRDLKEKNREKEKFNRKKQDGVKEREERVRKKSRTPSPGPEKMKKGPLNALLVELGSSDSASPLSEDEDSIPSFKLSTKAPAKIVPENKIQPTVNMSPKLKSTNLNSSAERTEKDAEKHSKIDEILKNKRDKSPGKKNKKSDGEVEKRRAKEHRRRSTSSDREKEEEETEKQRREEAEAFEKEQAEKEEEKPKLSKKEKDPSRKRKRDKGSEQSGKLRKDLESENNLVGASQSTGLMDPLETTAAAAAEAAAAVAAAAAAAAEETKKTEKFTKEYVAQLRDLQHRIMTLEDNEDLQKVVEVIAETGQYEITKKTFDFDLCALDGDTIRRLQEFFSPT